MPRKGRTAGANVKKPTLPVLAGAKTMKRGPTAPTAPPQPKAAVKPPRVDPPADQDVAMNEGEGEADTDADPAVREAQKQLQEALKVALEVRKTPGGQPVLNRLDVEEILQRTARTRQARRNNPTS